MVDGIIYIAGHARKINCFPENFGTPAVMAYAYDQNPMVSAVLPDDETSAYQMTRYLIRKGHKKIALLAGREDNLHTRRRLKGYQYALFDAQILYNPRLVRYVDWNKPSGYQETKR